MGFVWGNGLLSRTVKTEGRCKAKERPMILFALIFVRSSSFGQYSLIKLRLHEIGRSFCSAWIRVSAMKFASGHAWNSVFRKIWSENTRRSHSALRPFTWVACVRFLFVEALIKNINNGVPAAAPEGKYRAPDNKWVWRGQQWPPYVSNIRSNINPHSLFFHCSRNNGPR